VTSDSNFDTVAVSYFPPTWRPRPRWALEHRLLGVKRVHVAISGGELINIHDDDVINGHSAEAKRFLTAIKLQHLSLPLMIAHRMARPVEVSVGIVELDKLAAALSYASEYLFAGLVSVQRDEIIRRSAALGAAR
jgi:hypothetical protein